MPVISLPGQMVPFQGPLPNTPTRYSTTVNVLDYGADPTGQRDSTAAFQAAFDVASQTTPATSPSAQYNIPLSAIKILIPSGLYTLSTSLSALTLNPPSNAPLVISIEAEGFAFIVGPGQSPFTLTIESNAALAGIGTILYIKNLYVAQISVTGIANTQVQNCVGGVEWFSGTNANDVHGGFLNIVDCPGLFGVSLNISSGNTVTTALYTSITNCLCGQANPLVTLSGFSATQQSYTSITNCNGTIAWFDNADVAGWNHWSFSGVYGPPGEVVPSGNILAPTTPAVPATGVAVANTNYFPIACYVVGGTVTSIELTSVGGTVTTGATAGLVIIPPGDSIILNYTAAPSWAWVGFSA